MDHIVDIADYYVIKSDEDAPSLVTYSLGSCIGVAVWDPVAHVGGMLHYMLPESSISPERARHNPAMFADTGLPLLFKSAYRIGAEKDHLMVKVAGGSQFLDDNGTFNIGKRNYLILRRIFSENGILIHGEHVGGNLSRTMRLNLRTGAVTVRSKEGEVEI